MPDREVEFTVNAMSTSMSRCDCRLVFQSRVSSIGAAETKAFVRRLAQRTMLSPIVVSSSMAAVSSSLLPTVLDDHSYWEVSRNDDALLVGLYLMCEGV